MEHGLILGRYRPLADLGEGGHGAVELAFDTKMSRRVAIKRIPISRAGVKRLEATSGLREARTAALLNHPNVVTVHEWDTDEDEAFLIMEHVDGVSLASLLDEYAPLELDETAAIIGPVCDALAFAHANGVLHLDLKPENVLVTRDGFVKVADFGVASLTNAAGQALSAGGTLGYMPPEQLRGDPVDTRADVWALATLAYETVTGTLPFAADSVQAALYKAENVVPPMPSEFVDGLPVEMDGVLAAALSPVPRERQESAEVFASELFPLLGDPEAGRDALRDLVDALLEEEEGAPSIVRLGLWDRILHNEPALRHAAVALASAGVAWAGVGAFRLGWPATLGAAAAAGVAGAIAPPYGLTAAALSLVAGAFTLGPAHGLVTLVAAAAWWWLLGRRADWASLVPLSAPLFGALAVAPALPLLAGLAVRDPRRTFAAGAGAGVALVLASTASGAAPSSLVVDLAVIADPLARTAWRGVAFSVQDWVSAVALVTAFAAATAISALFARRATRPAALAGTVIGGLVVFAGVGPWVTGGQQVGPGAALRFGLSSILVAVAIALGPPVAEAIDE